MLQIIKLSHNFLTYCIKIVHILQVIAFMESLSSCTKLYPPTCQVVALEHSFLKFSYQIAPTYQVNVLWVQFTLEYLTFSSRLEHSTSRLQSSGSGTNQVVNMNNLEGKDTIFFYIPTLQTCVL